jgi:hypothetical protein
MLSIEKPGGPRPQVVQQIDALRTNLGRYTQSLSVSTILEGYCGYLK